MTAGCNSMIATLASHPIAMPGPLRDSNERVITAAPARAESALLLAQWVLLARHWR